MFATKGIGWLALFCAFLAGVFMYPLVIWGMYAAASMHRVEPMFIGRTTVMESAQGQPTRLGDLENLTTSQAVLSGAAQSLSDLGVNPAQVLQGVKVEPINDTNILAIEVTSPDAKEAKVAADVIAAELKKAYARFHSDDSARVLKTIDPAFVRPAARHRSFAASLGCFLTSRMAGPISALIVGLAFGLLFGLLVRNRRQPLPTQQGV